MRPNPNTTCWTDSVPKNEYESLQKKYEELQVKYSQMKKGTLLKMYDQL